MPEYMFGLGRKHLGALGDEDMPDVDDLRTRERTVHHRRFASGTRTCIMDTPTVPTYGTDTPDPKKVTCPACRADLVGRATAPQVGA